MDTQLNLGVLIVIYLVAVAIGLYVSYWVIRLGVLHAIRDSHKPEKPRPAAAPVPPATPWFSKDA